MRDVVLWAPLLLSGCATQAERAAAVQHDVDDMIQVYGPGCERLGYKPDTDAWRDCVLNLANRETEERYLSRAREHALPRPPRVFPVQHVLSMQAASVGHCGRR